MFCSKIVDRVATTTRIDKVFYASDIASFTQFGVLLTVTPVDNRYCVTRFQQ